MLDMLRPVWAQINLDNFIHNIATIKAMLKKDTILMAVVKANAYGHGALKISEVALQNGIDRLAVATLDEALTIKQKLPNAKILVLGYTPPTLVKEAVQNDITLCVYSRAVAEAISKEAVSCGKNAQIHIKIDSGMGRIGYQCSSESVGEITQIANLPNLTIESFFTHFASADESMEYTKEQVRIFDEFLLHLKKVGVSAAITHLSNSAAIMLHPHTQANMVRAGIILYGLSPAECISVENLKPMMSLKTKIVHLKTIKKGQGVSYGRTFIASKDTKIATLPLGYADGYMRAFSNKASVLIRGSRAKIVGNICMDQCMVDVSEIPGVSLNDEVVLFGRDEAGNEISVNELAKIAGTINYEIICAVSNRVPRIYLQNGQYTLDEGSLRLMN